MNPEQENSWAIPQRQPASGLLVALVKALFIILKAFWPLIILIFFRENKKGFDTFEILLMTLPLLIIVKAIADFFYLRFYILDGNLVIKKGFIQKKNITIPLQRIHAVDLEQNLIHRMFNVSTVKVDTAGSEKTEAVIDVLEWEKATALKNFLLSSDTESIVDDVRVERIPFPEKIIMSLDFGQLMKMGLSANHIQAIFIVFAFAVSALQNLEEIFGQQIIDYVKTSSDSIQFTFNILTLLSLAVLLISVFVSLIKTILQYSNFLVAETARGFRIEWGLINTRQNLVPYNKIQYLSWSANWIRRMIKLYYLDLHQATRDASPKKQRIKIPLSAAETIRPMLKHYHEEIISSAESQHKMYRAYPWRRLLIHAIPVASVITLAGYFWLYNMAFLALLYIPYDFISSVIFQRNFRVYITDSAVMRVQGVWGRHVALIKWYKIQHVIFKQSLFQRRKGLATVHLVTAGGTVVLPFLHEQLAWKIYNHALYKIESREGIQQTSADGMFV